MTRLIVYKWLHQFKIIDWLNHWMSLKWFSICKYIFFFSCVCRWLPLWTTWPFFMANEGSTRKQNLCVKGLWRSERRWVRGQMNESCVWLRSKCDLEFFPYRFCILKHYLHSPFYPSPPFIPVYFKDYWINHPFL